MRSRLLDLVAGLIRRRPVRGRHGVHVDRGIERGAPGLVEKIRIGAFVEKKSRDIVVAIDDGSSPSA